MSSASKASERSRPTAATSEKPWCLTSRRAVFSASCAWRPSRAACSFRRSAWVRRATPRGSSAEQLQRTRRVAVVERPLGGEQPRALFGRARRGAASGDRQRLAQLLVAQRPVLQAMRAAGGEQVAEHGELVVLGQLGRLDLDRAAPAAPTSGPACSGRRSTGPGRRAGRPGRCGRAGRRAIRAPAAAGRPASSAPGSRRRSESRCRSAPAGTG